MPDEPPRHTLRDWLGREPTEEELFVLRRARAPESQSALTQLVSQILADNQRLRAECSQLQDQLRHRNIIRPQSEVTVRLRVNFGGTDDISRAVEHRARLHGVICRTRVVKTGLLSKRLDFNLRATAPNLERFLLSLRRWGDTNGFGWIDA